MIHVHPFSIAMLVYQRVTNCRMAKVAGFFAARQKCLAKSEGKCLGAMVSDGGGEGCKPLTIVGMYDTCVMDYIYDISEYEIMKSIKSQYLIYYTIIFNG